MAKGAEVGNGGSDCEDKTVKRLPSKNLNRVKDYLTLDARQAFIQSKQAFTKAPIRRHFDPKYHIQIETDASGYAIGRVLSQLTSDNLGWWHSVAYYSRKMILAETWYKICDGKLLAIVKALTIRQHYLKGCKHKLLMFINHSNLCHFIKTKSLSSRQVWWA